MADFTFNVSKGRGIQMALNVENNDPTAAVLRVYAIVSTDTDAAIKVVDTMAALFALTNTLEATNTNYASLTDDGTDLTFDLDDTTHFYDAILADQTFTTILAGDNWTHLIVAYDADGTGTAATTIPMSSHDFVVTPNGGNIVADFPITGFFRAGE